MDLVMDDNDLLMEILVHLPVRSLIIFKSVCKNWLSIISDDRFCHQHTLRRPKLQQSFIVLTDTNSDLFYWNPTMEYSDSAGTQPWSILTDPDFIILHACNGLLLLNHIRRTIFSQYTSFDTRNQKKSFYVYNPATKLSRKISLTKSYDYPHMDKIKLAFDPSKSPHYKIVCLRSATDTGSHFREIEVYDSESHTWKLRLEGVEYGKISCGVYWNNAIYWSSDGGYCSFDIAKNEMRVNFT